MRKPRVHSRAYAPDPQAPGRACEMADCPEAGEYRAPKSRTSLHEYWWFCLEHVRAYNAAWDYYKGMTPGQIEAQLRADTSWQRPTWPLGRLGPTAFDASAFSEDVLADPLATLQAGRINRGRTRPSADATPAELREPLSTLGLQWPLTMDALKDRYKALAKRHHPDANGGDRAAEERLKTINLAYAALRAHLVPRPAQDAGLAATG